MSGSRTNSPSYGDRSTLDDLNRTIEGLEARIEGLIGASPRDIRSRLFADRDAVHDRAAPQRRPESYQQPLPGPRNDVAIHAVPQALGELRHDLKQDIHSSVSREMGSLRAEMRTIATLMQDRHAIEDVRGDLARLAEGIDQLGHQYSPETVALRADFDHLRMVIDGIAREDSVQRIETRWHGLEDRIQQLDPQALREDIAALAYRIEDVKAQLSGMSGGPAVRALEEKLLTVATAVEQIGLHMQPDNGRIAKHFSGLDDRLDEISRAIAAGNRSVGQSGDNSQTIQRIEGRIMLLGNQIDAQIDALNAVAALRDHDASGLAARLEALATRIEELAEQQATDRAADRVEERLDRLFALVEQNQTLARNPELMDYLADLSRKLDRAGNPVANDAMALRLEEIAQRIEQMDLHAQSPQPLLDDASFRRLEDRLSSIADRLDETALAPPMDNGALKGLEEQIAHLSVLIGQQSDGRDMPGEHETRMMALEDYMATSDEYIVEAARQAAEAVVEAYVRHNGQNRQTSAAEMEVLSGLAQDMRHLEALSRSSEERTHHTFEALHGTLVQIAGRLDSMENRLEQTDFGARMDPSQPAEQQPFAGDAGRISDIVEDDLFAQMRIEDEDEPARPAPSPSQQTHAHGIYAEPKIREIEPMSYSVADTGAPETVERPASARKSLLNGLAKRFRAEPAAEPLHKPERALVDPSPSIDAADELTAPDGEFELLEPGSGAPDVRKILEKVRATQKAASQQAQSDGDRTDYIAAARRAAQAAVLETDDLDETRPQDGKGKFDARNATGLSRHRRPIMMGVGAILLAIMAMPLVNTLTGANRSQTSGETNNVTPEPAQQKADETAQPAPVSHDQAVTQQPQADTDTATTAAPALQSPPQPEAQDRLQPLPQSPEEVMPASAATDIPAMTGPAVAEALPIVVPDGIEPKSLADAAQAGDPMALFEIGLRYTEGRGVVSNLAQAAAWYKLAADRGLAPAQYRVANFYEKGTGVPRDIATAVKYYSMAAASGNAGAMHNLAVIQASGANGAPDYAAAAEWFRKAADMGVSDSQFNLAVLYARGSGIAQDIEESYKWFAIAARGGDVEAEKKRQEVAGSMQPEQLESARSKLETWKAISPDADANTVNMPDEWIGKGTRTASIDMTRAIQNIQTILNQNGFDAGTPDGRMGKKTVSAIKAFQTSVGQTPTGKVDNALVKELLGRNKP